MSYVKWIKIATDIFDDEKMLLIENLPSADSIQIIWFKLLCFAGKKNNSGVFLFKGKIPYNHEMLATIFGKDINIIRLALETFENLGMIDIVNGVITIPNWDKHQSLDAYEKKKARDRLYQQKRRNKQKLLIEATTSNHINVIQSSDVVFSEQEQELEKELEKEIEVEVYNTTTVNYEKKDIEKVTKILSDINVNYNQALEIYIKANGDMKNIEKVYEYSKTQNIDNIIPWLKKLVVPGAFIEKRQINNRNKKLKFDNFESRDYDYDKLEKRLLGWE